MLSDKGDVVRLAEEHKVPETDVTLMALNLTGVSGPDYSRTRFKLDASKELGGNSFYIAVPVRPQSPFKIEDGTLILGKDHVVGTIEEEPELDTCDSHYFRRGGTALNLNSNERSGCRGCAMCGTYSQGVNDDDDLTRPANLGKTLRKIAKGKKWKDLSNLQEIAVCTGCFPNEEEALLHLLMVGNVARSQGFNGELKYIGSQITTEESMRALESVAPFSLYGTVEFFRNRDKYLRPEKRHTLDEWETILNRAREHGHETNTLHVLGIDPQEAVEEFERFTKGTHSRFPIINTFQAYVEGNEKLRHPDAKTLDYYLNSRKRIEEIMGPTGLRPQSWECYRPLWYTSFADEPLGGIKI